MKTTDLYLYIRAGCPFCDIVEAYLTNQNIQVPTLDISDTNHYQSLLQKGGKAQVPCLMINQKALYESLDIIAWFKQQASILAHD